MTVSSFRRFRCRARNQRFGAENLSNGIEKWREAMGYELHFPE